MAQSAEERRERQRERMARTRDAKRRSDDVAPALPGRYVFGHTSVIVGTDGIARYTLSRSHVARVRMVVYREAFADGCGRCHDANHSGTDVHACTHGGHESTQVGRFTPRAGVRVTDREAARIDAMLDASHASHVADCKECKRAVTMSNASWTRTYKAPSVPPTPRSRTFVPREGESMLDAIDRVLDARECAQG